VDSIGIDRSVIGLNIIRVCIVSRRSSKQGVENSAVMMSKIYHGASPMVLVVVERQGGTDGRRQLSFFFFFFSYSFLLLATVVVVQLYKQQLLNRCLESRVGIAVISFPNEIKNI
jgi:hypothetical protein